MPSVSIIVQTQCKQACRGMLLASSCKGSEQTTLVYCFFSINSCTSIPWASCQCSHDAGLALRQAAAASHASSFVATTYCWHSCLALLVRSLQMSCMLLTCPVCCALTRCLRSTWLKGAAACRHATSSKLTAIAAAHVPDTFIILYNLSWKRTADLQPPDCCIAAQAPSSWVLVQHRPACGRKQKYDWAHVG